MIDNDITEIVPHLFLSNWFTSNNPYVLNKNKIKAVVTLETMNKPDNILLYQKMNGIQSLYIRLPDSPSANIYQYFDMTYDFINDKISRGENVLVHCYAGVSRSSAIVLNYILRTFYQNEKPKANPQEVLYLVLEFVQRKRSIVNPNQGFLNQLLQKTIQYNKGHEKPEYFCIRKIYSSSYF